MLKLRSDQTGSVSVDLHQQRVNGDGRLLSFGLTCGRLRSQKKQKQPLMHPETPAEVGQAESFNSHHRYRTCDPPAWPPCVTTTVLRRHPSHAIACKTVSYDLGRRSYALIRSRPIDKRTCEMKMRTAPRRSVSGSVSAPKVLLGAK
jgi:hypothetical protein